MSNTNLGVATMTCSECKETEARALDYCREARLTLSHGLQTDHTKIGDSLRPYFYEVVDGIDSPLTDRLRSIETVLREHGINVLD